MVTIEAQTRQRDFHDEDGPGRVRVPIVAHVATDHRHVRLGFGILIEGEGQLRAQMPAAAERGRERTLHEPDARRMGTVLWLLAHHGAADQLDTKIGAEKYSTRVHL